MAVTVLPIAVAVAPIVVVVVGVQVVNYTLDNNIVAMPTNSCVVDTALEMRSAMQQLVIDIAHRADIAAAAAAAAAAAVVDAAADADGHIVVQQTMVDNVDIPPTFN